MGENEGSGRETEGEREREQGCHEDVRRTEISKEGGRGSKRVSVPALSSAAATADGKARECLLLPQLGANQYSRSTFTATLSSVRFYRGDTI